MAYRRPWLRRLRRRWRDMRSLPARFDFRPDDNVIVSYPKSGSTWLRFILAYLVPDGDGNRGRDIDFEQVQRYVPDIAKTTLARGADFARMPSPRVMRSHSLFVPRFPKVVYLLRDGRDVLVSFYHHHRKLRGFHGSFSDFLRGRSRRTEWAEHVENWIFQNPLAEKLCVIRYENMLADTSREIRQVLKFVGLPCTNEEIQRAIERSAFDRMRRIEETKGLSVYRTHPQNAELRFIRRGVAGDWRETFTEADKAYFKEQFGGTLIKAGYETSNLW